MNLEPNSNNQIVNINKKSTNIFKNGGIKGFFAANRLKKIIGLTIFIILICGTVVVFALKSTGTANSTASQRTEVVRKGNLSTTVSGSGPIASSNKTTILSKVSSTVTQVYFKRGDKVKKGDLIMELDSSDAESSVSTNESNLRQAELTMESTMENVENLNPKAPFDGQVTNVTIKVGDSAGSNASLMTLSDTSKLKFSVSFSAANINGIIPGKNVTVNVMDTMDSVNGKVTSVSSLPYATSQGGSLYNVEIQIDNPGSLKEGMKANADINVGDITVSSVDESTLSYINKQLIRTAGGTVKNVFVVENQNVKKGTILASLENKDVILSKTTNDLKVLNLQNQLKVAQEQLDSCKIIAPFDGAISSLTVKVSDDIKAGAELVTVFNDKSMEFDVSVDELDIQKIKVGQQVNITVDAITETKTKPLTGKVADISIQGTSSSGVTTYPVTISVDNPENLKIGMNSNAEILILNKTGVLMVPLEAVQKIGGKNYIMLKSDAATIEKMKKEGTYPNISNGNSPNKQGAGSQGSNNQQNNTKSSGNSNSNNSTQKSTSTASGSTLAQNTAYYADALPSLVEIGSTDGSYFEITSGVKEGDIIILPPQTQNKATSTTQQNGMGGMGGIPGAGGPPPAGRN